MKKIIIIGNFGKSGKVDGQIVKTRTIYNSIKKRYKLNYKVVVLDTSKKNIFFYAKSIKEIITAYRIIILPAYSALKPLLFLINCLNATQKTIHIAIGGWLDSYLNDKRWLNIENKLISVLVEIESLKLSLEKLGLKNVVYFPNYRENSQEKISVSEKKTPYRKFVFCARIIPEKGIIEAIDSIKILNKKDNKYFLDIYGPLSDDFKEKFFKRINNVDNIKYLGILEQRKIITTLNKYDALLFPTYYRGEGFPGILLETFMAGVPVIASDWNYNKEIIKIENTGLLCKIHSVESIINCIETLNNNLEKYKKMPINCKQKAEEFTEEKVTKILFDLI